MERRRIPRWRLIGGALGILTAVVGAAITFVVAGANVVGITTVVAVVVLIVVTLPHVWIRDK